MTTQSGPGTETSRQPVDAARRGALQVATRDHDDEGSLESLRGHPRCRLCSAYRTQIAIARSGTAILTARASGGEAAGRSASFDVGELLHEAARLDEHAWVSESRLAAHWAEVHRDTSLATAGTTTGTPV